MQDAIRKNPKKDYPEDWTAVIGEVSAECIKIRELTKELNDLFEV